ncbi:MAG: Gfo/Idh/MocA family oxidoreductase [Actinomycetota bacterium]|nr:Gfo/Idh/MocA family oxidoreductase [Actinomycetota bacterium]
MVSGVGLMGRLHAGEYASMEDVELVGLVEPDVARHEALRQEYQVPVAAHPEVFLGECDVVSVCAPDHLHLAAVSPWLAAGARILLEKPLAMSVQEGQEILAGRRHVDDLMIGHILRFDPRVIRIRELVRSGQLGEVKQVEVWRSTTRTVGATPSSRTSVAWFLGIHDADLVRFTTGLELDSLSSVGSRWCSDHYDAVYSLIRYTSGAIGTMSNYWTLPDGRPNRAHAGLRVIGSTGSVETDLGHIDLLHSTMTGAVNPDTRFWPSATHTGVSNIGVELRAFVDAAKTGAPTPVSGEDGLAAVSVIERIHAELARNAGDNARAGH